MTRHPPNGKTSKQMDDEHAVCMDAKPITESCLHCGWTFTGSAGEGREHAAQHRAEHHPDIRPVRRRKVSLHKFVNRDDGWREAGVRNAAEVAELLKRAEKRVA